MYPIAVHSVMVGDYSYNDVQFYFIGGSISFLISHFGYSLLLQQ
jgi:uncharacterized membrane protein YhhN